MLGVHIVVGRTKAMIEGSRRAVAVWAEVVGPASGELGPSPRGEESRAHQAT